ncbi:hypothetical protein A2U01_0114923, partial [Trifolium medium]|nr:hypothetical protein [Trifolium medium]
CTCVAERGMSSLSESVAMARLCSPVTLKSPDLSRQLLVERGLVRELA